MVDHATGIEAPPSTHPLLALYVDKHLLLLVCAHETNDIELGGRQGVETRLGGSWVTGLAPFLTAPPLISVAERRLGIFKSYYYGACTLADVFESWL